MPVLVLRAFQRASSAGIASAVHRCTDSFALAWPEPGRRRAPGGRIAQRLRPYAHGEKRGLLTVFHLSRSPFFRINAVNPKNIPFIPLLTGLKIFVTGLIKAYTIHPKGRSAFPNPLLRKKT
jgi:hypothetical protein